MKKNWKYLMCFIIWIVVFIIIRNMHVPYIPDFFNISNFSEAIVNDYFKMLCGITATIFAILLAVITFGFELLGNNSRRRKRINILSKWPVSLVISIPVSIIIFSFFSAFTIFNLNQVNDITTAYFIGFLFIIFVIILFPFTIYLLKEIVSFNEVEKKIKQFSGIKEYDSFIKDELIYHVQQFDIEAYNKILNILSHHSLSLIGNTSNREQTNRILQSLIEVWKIGNIDALRVGEQQYFNSIFFNLKGLYEHAAKNNSLLLHYQSLEQFIRIEIDLLKVNNCINSLAYVAKTLSEIFLHQLEHNCPPQKTISNLYWAYEKKDAPYGYDKDADIQWDYIIHILWEINHIHKIAVDLKSKFLFESVKSILNDILFNLNFNKSIKLEKYQEASIVNEIYDSRTQYALLALKNGIFQDDTEVNLINIQELADYIRQKKIFAKNLIDNLEEYALKCHKNNKLSYSTISCIGKLGKLISLKYKNNLIVQNIFFSIVELLNKLKTEIQKDINHHENTNYNLIKKELKYLKDSLIRVDDISITEKTTFRIDEILNSF